MAGFHVGRLIIATLVIEAALTPSLADAQNAATLAETDRVMEHYRLDAHIPGMVWGIVKDGKLVHVKSAGVQDIEAKRPVTPDTLFRIASMTKAFTALSILRLRDEGKLSLEAPAETYVPELKALKYPTDDSPKIRVRELLTHTAGFVTDDPWGDRQTPLRVRPGSSGANACREASTYAMGFNAATDCELGLTLSHGGGYPGYGSHVLLLPDYGVGIFALANRTYAGPRPPV